MKKTTTIAALCLCIFLVGCSSSQANKPTNDTPAQPEQDAVEETSEETNTQRNMDSLTQIIFKTTLGDITIALYDNTPQHRDNFIKLVKDNYYKDVLFHRIIKGFMIQTGDPDSKGAPVGKQLGQGGPGYTIPAEFRPENYHKRGAVAAARQADQVNPTKASSGSQFYIVDGQKFDERMLNQISMQYHVNFTDEQRKVYMEEGGAPFLDMQYTVFGEVVKGMEVVDKIASQEKDRFDRPYNDIKIISTTIVE
jgi:peptidyl-prolyl cis-trans isomerase B (cyclophilin B)